MSSGHKRTSKAGFPFRGGDSKQRLSYIFDPTRGLHSGIHYDELAEGFTPQSQNFVVRAGGVEPRSGLSKVTKDSSAITVGFIGADEPVLGGGEVFDENQNAFALALTDSSVFLATGRAGIWRELTGPGLSNTSRDYWEHTYVADVNNNRNIAVLCNGLDVPKFFDISTAAATYENFTAIDDDQGHTAPKATTVADGRLVFANLASPERRPNRVAWSVRGNPLNFSVVDGAGFQDLPELRGQILSLKPSEDGGFYVFSSEEIWRARPRRDLFAFDFFPMTTRLAAMNPRVIRSTAAGVIFLARDREVYSISGNQIIPLGILQQGENSRVQSFINDEVEDDDRPFSVYSERERRWELYYRPDGVDELSADTYPTRALYYDIEANSFLEQRLTHEVSYGFGFGTFGETDDIVTWDDLTVQWNSVSSTWDYNIIATGTPAAKRTTLFSSHGTVDQLARTESADWSGEIDARWRSGGLRHPEDDEPHRRIWAWELWTEFNSDSASDVTVAWSEDGGASFREERALSLPSSNYSAVRFPARMGGRGVQFEIRGAGNAPNFNRMTIRLDQGAER